MPEANTTSLEAAVLRSAEMALDRIAAARTAIGAVIFGQEQVVEEALVTLLSGGHGLLVGVPGLAKTKLVEALGKVLGLNARRVQFTPDLMPADILGSEVLEETADHRRSFRFVQGPIFAQLLMADEINRASPRTQSALLQAMQEHHVSVAGERHDLPHPFHVLATQNPLEQEGTYPLPEAQLDRFLMQIDVTYPDRAAEKRILIETTGDKDVEAKPAMSADDLDHHATPRAASAGRRAGCRSHSRSRPFGAAGGGRFCHHPTYRLGAGAARGASADAGDARSRARRWPSRAFARRRGRAGRAGAETSHGAHLRRAGGRRNGARCHCAAHQAFG